MSMSDMIQITILMQENSQISLSYSTLIFDIHLGPIGHRFVAIFIIPRLIPDTRGYQ